MPIKPIVVIASCLILALYPVSIVQAQTISDQKAELCSSEWHYIPKTLITHLGTPTSCDVVEYDPNEFGLHSTIELSWNELVLTIKHRPPESGTYIIETANNSSLTLDWLKANKDKMIQSGFEIDWDNDQFAGPSGQHYISKDTGTNAQVWIEHDKDGRIIWFRFSYAL